MPSKHQRQLRKLRRQVKKLSDENDESKARDIEQAQQLAELASQSASADSQVAQNITALSDRLSEAEQQVSESLLAQNLGSPVLPKTFSNWCDLVQTDVPVLFPKTDRDVLDILENAYLYNRKVRVAGATHAAAGLVTSGENPVNQDVISLFEYIPDDPDWRLGGGVSLEDNKVRVEAAKSYLDLVQYIRPKCYFVPTVTAAFTFTIGGTISTPSHGRVYGADLINRYVSKLLVADFDPQNPGKARVREVSSPEIRDWRAGYGLLGVILSVEFSDLVFRDNFKIFPVRDRIEWTEETFYSFLENSRASYIQSDMFFDCRGDGEDATVQIIQAAWNQKKEGEHVPIGWKCDAISKLSYKAWYDIYQGVWGPKSRHPIGLYGDKGHGIINGALETLTDVSELAANSKVVAGGMMDVTLIGIETMCVQAGATTNDGFWSQGALGVRPPCATMCAYFCPYAYAYEYMSAYRKVVLDNWNQGPLGKNSRFNSPLEFGVLDIGEDGPTTMSIPAGRYIDGDATGLSGYTPKRVDESFQELERAWLSIPYAGGEDPSNAKYIPPEQRRVVNGEEYVPVYPHTAKRWAYGSAESDYAPFQKSRMRLVDYGCFGAFDGTGEANRAAFVARLDAADPKKVFRTAMASWLVEA